MARVKNNNEYRTKVGNLMRNALESNPNNKKMLDYSNTLEQVKVDYKNYFDIAKTIVKRSYPEEHCNVLNYTKLFMVRLVMLLLMISATISLILIKIV